MPAPTRQRQRRRRGSVSQRPDGMWQVQLTRKNGRRITRYISADTPQAERAAEDLLATLVHEELHSTTQPNQMRLSEWLGEYLMRANRGKAASTIRNRERYARDITAALGGKRLDQLTPRHCQSWADGLEGSHSERSKKVQLLRSALNEAVALDYLPRNPALTVKLERQDSRHKVASAWTPEQVKTFLEANEGTGWVNLWHLALLTGARIGELLALQVSDYDAAKGTLKIERTQKRADGKGTRPTVGQPKTPAARRRIPLTPEAQAVVEAQLANRAELARAGESAGTWTDEGWLFCTGRGTFIAYSNARRAFQFALDKADVPRIRTHDLRVTFISLALRRGAKPEVIAKIVGHSSPSITLNIYRQVYEDEMQETRDILSNLF